MAMKAHSDLRHMSLEALGFDHVILLGWQSVEAVEYTMRTHSHPGVFELLFVPRGKLTYRIDGCHHTLCGGDLLLIPPGMAHDSDMEPLCLCERYWLQIRESQSGVLLPGLSEEDSAELVSLLRRVPVRPFRGGEAMADLFEGIRSAYCENETPLRVVKLGNRLLKVILDFLELVANDAPNKNSNFIEKTIRLIETSRCAIPVPELARYARMPEPTFKIRFKKEIGLSPAEYVIRHRVRLAQTLLLTTTRSVTEIAHELDFSSSQHFAMVFRRHIGVSPNLFRDGHSRNPLPAAGSGAEFNALVRL